MNALTKACVRGTKENIHFLRNHLFPCIEVFIVSSEGRIALSGGLFLHTSRAQAVDQVGARGVRRMG